MPSYAVCGAICLTTSRHIHQGPKPLPLLGNLLDMTVDMNWERFSEWNARYGDVVYLRILGRSIVLLNSEKRADKYSHRPQFPLINLYPAINGTFGFLPYGKKWQSRRRLFTSQYNSMVTLRSFYDAHRSAVGTFLLNVLRDPEAISNHLRIRSAQGIFDVTYGIRVTSWDDSLIHTAEAVMTTVSLALNPGMWIINPLPIFKCLPNWFGGSAIAAKIEQCQTDLENLRNVPFGMVKKSMEEGTARPCFTTNLLREFEAGTGVVDEELVRDTAAIAMGGNFFNFNFVSLLISPQTYAAGEIFLLAMVMNPDMQRQAHEEIEAVVGMERLADFRDRDHLPYITAISKEVLRWHPPAPIGIPHELMEDDVYDGMLIPAGSIIMVNIWQMLHDPEIYPNPMKFDPGRYMRDGKLDLSENDPSRCVFSVGRRSCPGKLFAEDSLWLLIAQFLSVYAIKPSPEGPTPRAAFTMGGISQPLPFGRIVYPRSDAARHLLAQVEEDMN
ncbi:cytochrome P450 [Roridomyces roridus]|uniref:Cytochrome P450 n=1 Tax=Roridomyces roridus TaxID=1738132 RepID=A0AAD7BAW8_9AGAR|nr:cytochrome P450 [Roridomyces roridus]